MVVFMSEARVTITVAAPARRVQRVPQADAPVCAAVRHDIRIRDGRQRLTAVCDPDTSLLVGDEPELATATSAWFHWASSPLRCGSRAGWQCCCRCFPTVASTSEALGAVGLADSSLLVVLPVERFVGTCQTRQRSSALADLAATLSSPRPLVPPAQTTHLKHIAAPRSPNE